jgi:WD40 repeat protein/class 3 adenylate cyclase
MAVRAREGQRPAVRTFLIADIRGYTRFTSERGDEAASRLAAEFATIAHEGVEAWAGTLLELRGDEALAVFDSPRLALRCAVELQAAFASETQADPSLPLRVGIGLDAGEAVALSDGYRGAALNLAARLCAAAGPGEVIASEGLIHLAGTVPGLAVNPLPVAELKGFDGSVTALQVCSEEITPPTPAAGTERPPRPLPAQLDPIVPLVGRAAELRWLSWHWRRARQGDGRAVVISGLPGIGKTRMSAELATAVHAAGAAISYLPAGRGLNEVYVEQLAATGAALVVLDDLEAAPEATARSVAPLAARLAGKPLLLLVTHSQAAPPALLEIVAGFATAERRRELEALEPESVRSIAALYAGPAADALPIDEMMRESGGVPAAVHRLVSGWAREVAVGRLGTFARHTSAGRRGLRTAEQGLIGSVEALELARERTALYVLTDEEQAAVDEAEPRVEVCPYKGLAAFEAPDSKYFFGRERLVAELVARLVGASFLGVVGASGSGKSSALRAGLLPALAGGVLPGSDGWPQVVVRPGEQPLAELRGALAAALPRAGLPSGDPAAVLDGALATLAPDQRLVLVVDQFEEVFNATRDEAERQAFIELLTSERRGLKVIVAMRADHYGHCAPYVELATLMGTSQLLVGPLTRLELAAVIKRPAQRVGLRAEPGLTETLLDDLGDEPGSLPLLSTALLELWQARDHGRLTLAAYQAIGGVRGAVARLAEAAYARLDSDQQRSCRSVFLRLSGPGEGEGLVRRRVPLSEFDIDSDAPAAHVLEALTDARLLTTGEGHVEVAHEALLREWPRLQGWLADDAAGRELRLHLTATSHAWEEGGRESGDLYRGARLSAALEWAAGHEPELNASEREFLAAGRAESERELHQQRRTNRRLRLLLSGAGVFLLLAIAAGGFALDQAQRAEREAAAAELAARVANARSLGVGAQNAVDEDPELSLLLALAGLDEIGSAQQPILPEIVEALHAGVIAQRIVLRVANDAKLVAWSPDGRRLLVSAQDDPAIGDAFVRVINVQSGNTLAELRREDGDGPLLHAVFDPAGERIVTTHAGKVTALLWNASSGLRLPLDLEGHSGKMLDPVVTPDGRQLAVSNDDGTVSVWDLTMRTETYSRNVAAGRIEARPQLSYGPSGIDISPDGRLMVTAEPDLNGAVLRRVEDGEPIHHLSTGAPDTYSVAFSPDGTRVAVLTGRPGAVWVFDVSGKLLHRFPAGAVLVAIDWSRKGIVVAGNDAAITIMDPENGREIATLRGHSEPVTAVAFSPDGTRLASAGLGRTTLVWDVTAAGRGEVTSYPADLGPVMKTMASPDGTRLYISIEGAPGLLHVLDARSGAVIDTLPDQLVAWPIGPALSPDGRLLATTGVDQVTRILDAETLKEDHPRLPRRFYVVAFSPDNTLVVVDGAGTGDAYRGPPRVLEVASGREVFKLSAGAIQGADWSPDGTLLATSPAAQGDGLVRVYTRSGEPLANGLFEHHSTHVAFSSDGSQLAVSGDGVLVVDVAALRAGRIEVVATLPRRSGANQVQVSYFSLDDEELVTVGLQEELDVWNASTWELMYTIAAPYANRSMSLLASGREIVAAAQPGPGGTPRAGLVVYTLDVDELIDIARDRLTRSFTTAECVRYLHLAECPTEAS